MARPRRDDAYLIHLTDEGDYPDEVGDGSAAAEVVAPPEAADKRAPSRLSVPRVLEAVRRNRRVLVPAVAALAVLALAGAGVGTLRERDRVEALAGAAGGVISLDALPEETWRVPGLGMAVAVLGDVVVFVDEAGVTGRTATGDIAWTVPLTGADCGTTGYFGAVQTAGSLVCLLDAAEARAVVAIDAAGAVSAPRPLDPDLGEAFPGPDGTVVFLRRVGDQAADAGDLTVECLGEGCTSTGKPAHVRDVEVRSERADTGELLWGRRIPARTSDDAGGTSGCLSYTPVGVGALLPEPSVDLEDMGLFVFGETVHVSGCGIRATFYPDGTELPGGLGEETVAHVPAGTVRLAVPSGGRLVNEVYSTGGDLRFTLPGTYLAPASRDGQEPAIHLVSRGGRLTAFDADGGELWAAETNAVQVPALTRSVVVARTAAKRLVGVDAVSGEVLWDREVPIIETSDDLSYDMEPNPPAFTDGRTLLLPLRAWTADGRPRWEAHGIDLGSGATAWTGPLPRAEWFIAVGGHLVGLEMNLDAGDPGDAQLDLVGLG